MYSTPAAVLAAGVFVIWIGILGRATSIKGGELLASQAF
jgi:hypothetical protein